MIKRLVAKFMFRAMTIWDALRTFRGSSATLWVPQEGLASPPFPIADGPDVVAFSATDSITTSVVSATTFQLAVRAKSPSSFWELNDTNGINAYDQTGGGNTGTLVGGVTANASGPFPGSTAMTFAAATSGQITTTASVSNPTTVTVMAAFSTTGSAGPLVGLINPQTGSATNYDRNLWIDGTALAFSVYNGGTVTVTSSATVNDGTWHLAIGTIGVSGMTLFLDGVSVATNANTSAQNYTGWWRMGGNADGAGGNQFYTGKEAYVATWDASEITAADVSDLWAAWQASLSGG